MGLAVCLLETARAHACHCFSICGKSVVVSCVSNDSFIQCVTVYESRWEGTWLTVTEVCASSYLFRGFVSKSLSGFISPRRG